VNVKVIDEHNNDGMVEIESDVTMLL